MNRRRLLAAAAAAVAVAVLPVAGCGVPSSGPPTVVKDARRDRDSTDPNRSVTKQTPAGVTDPLALVQRYLKAAAWVNEAGPEPDKIDKAVEPVKAFMTVAAEATWQRGQDITVVRVTRYLPPTPTANGTRVDVVLQPIGVLNSRGTVEPKVAVAQTYPFTVVPAERGAELRIANPPAGMLLSDEGLGELYDLQPIYFWDNAGGRNLVPDLRYIGKSASPENRLVMLTEWLRDGPSEFLKPVVNPLPPGIENKDRPVLDASGTVRINLSAKAASAQGQLPKLMGQLRWSLRPLARTVELQIEGQRQDPDLGAGLDNPAATPDGQKDPPRFGVVDGRVRHIGGDPLAVPALNSDDNAGVVSAAVLRGAAQQVALVREENGRQRLWLGAYNQTAKVAQYGPTDLVAGAMSRPVGLGTPAGNDPMFLVAADGKLFSVPASSRQATNRTPAGLGGPVTAVSVARDTRRVALVAGGRVYVGVLVFDGASPSVSQLEEVQAGLTDAVDVAWSREGWLVVAGRLTGQAALVELTIDSALVEQMQLRNLTGLTMTRVVADPVIRRDDPGRGVRGPIMIEANAHAYRVYSSSVDEWPPDPAPSPAPSGTPVKPSLPTAPFFVD
ncbi:LpqB family beta-propeller domain-containing protein [Planosporangium sp. 12N6]|uniref:LpqB family beta-propeller domain-containing protein n=1 Tax=Planosporangium spinosum TaxID=3402278 RepID=UPI003CF321F6